MTKVLGVFDDALMVHASHLVPERRASFERELSRVGIHSFEVVDAVVVDEALREQYNYTRPPHQNSVHALSLLLTMDKAIETAQSRGLKSVLMMQDDIVFREEFDEQWRSIKDEVLQTDWDMLFFYRWYSEAIVEPPGSIRLVPIEHTLCSHCIGIKADIFSAYRSVLRSVIEANEMDDTVATFKMLRDRGIRLYATNRNLAGQGDFASALSAAKGRAGLLAQFRVREPFDGALSD